MTTRSKRYVIQGQRPVHFDNFRQSRFWQRLEDLSRSDEFRGQSVAILHLMASVGKVADIAKWISYFTQVGKSYYRSPEFNQERAAMKAVGEVVSPISMFGIGILSCFMIADRLRIRTSPGNIGRASPPTEP